jgi:hypothetical protein
MSQALSAHGRSPEEIEALLEADNEPPSVQLVALPGLGHIQAFSSAIHCSSGAAATFRSTALTRPDGPAPISARVSPTV